MFVLLLSVVQGPAILQRARKEVSRDLRIDIAQTLKEFSVYLREVGYVTCLEDSLHLREARFRADKF